MQYKWNKKDLVNKKNYLESLLKKDSISKNEKEWIQLNADSISEMLTLFSHTPQRQKMFQPLLAHKTHKEYDLIPNNIKKWIWNSQTVLDNCNFDFPTPTIPTQIISNEEIVNLSQAFYQWIPNKNYSQLIDFYTNPKNHFLCIKENFISNYYGITFPIYFPTYTPYILVSKSYTVEDYITLNHELSHAIYMISSPRKSIETAFLNELEGFVFDKLSLLYLLEKKIVSAEIAKNIEILNFKNVIEYLLQFYFMFYKFQIRNRRDFENTNIQTIFKRVSLPKNLNIRSLTTDILSFLTFLDLDFDNDLERAFYYFESIKNNHKELLLKIFHQNHISFMNDGYQNLQNSMQKLHLTK